MWMRILGKLYEKNQDFSKPTPTISMKVVPDGVKMSRIKILKARGPGKFYSPRMTGSKILKMCSILENHSLARRFPYFSNLCYGISIQTYEFVQQKLHDNNTMELERERERETERARERARERERERESKRERDQSTDRKNLKRISSGMRIGMQWMSLSRIFGNAPSLQAFRAGTRLMVYRAHASGL